MFAGGTKNYNASYYLNIGNSYWTMSPGAFKPYANAFIISQNGGIIKAVVGNYKSGNIRPVINLRSDVTFSFGDGTQNNPYVVS